MNNLGQVAGAVQNILIHRNDMAQSYVNDMCAFGASGECYDLIFDEWELETNEQILECVHSFGYTLQEFKEELKSRVDSKWLFINDFFAII